MGFSDILRGSIVDECGLPWSERVPQAIGLFVAAVGMVLALQRHELTSPNLGALLIAVIILPWVLDMVGRPKRILRERRFEFPLLITWTVVVLAGVWFLSLDYRVSNDFAPFILTVLIGEMASTAGPRFGAAVWIVSVAMLVVFEDAYHFSGLYIWAFAFTIAWMGGAAYRAQVRNAYELSEAQTQLAERAAEEERHRLARDIHDLIAHSLAVTMLQLSGARLALKAGDTNDALAALEDAESAGRAAMTEIHRTVALLGSNGPVRDQLPTPCAADVPGLVANFREAGLEVEFDLEGDLGAVPLATGLASYRLVQESLSNAVKHAPGAPVNLRVRVNDRDIRIQVVNPIVIGARARSSSGNGLRGMVERAELLGGSVGAGNGDGTWKVEARIPWGLVAT
jgi:signal transduction histidine kinase